MKNKLIIVIDMLNGFAKFGPLASENVNKIIPKIYKNLSRGDDVIFIADAHSEEDLEMQIYPLHCAINSQEAEIVEELQEFVNSDNVYYKNTTNAFWELLQKRDSKNNSHIFEKYDQFELMGCCTDICVLQLALSMRTYFNKISMNKDIVVDSSLVATFDSPNHNAKEFHDFALKVMKQAGIKII